VNETIMNEASLESAAPTMRAALADYASLIGELAGDALAGLTLYGPVLGESFDPERMTATSVMVVSRIDLGLLRRLAEYGPKLGGSHISAPLVMTPGYIQGSLDSFPLELLEIHQGHVTLIGKDHFDALSFDAEHLRVQCEREFKRIGMRLRQGLLAAGSREDFLGALEVDIGQHLLRTLRGLIWLKGTRDTLSIDRVLAESERLVGDKLPGIGSAIRAHGEHDWTEFQSLYADVEKLAAMADEHK